MSQYQRHSVTDGWRRGVRDRSFCLYGGFFDSLNVNNFISGKFKRKAFQDPYRSDQDFRLKAGVCVDLYIQACTCT